MGARKSKKIKENTIGGRLAKFRNEIDKTQEEFSEELNISPDTLANYENNRTNIPDNAKRQISELYPEFDVHKLVTGKTLEVKKNQELFNEDNWKSFLIDLPDEKFVQYKKIIDEISNDKILKK